MADTDNLGLLVLNPDSGPSAVDIVAIHGLNGHRIESWTYRDEKTSEEVMWLKDMLPTRIANARVMTFGYDSYSTEYGGVTSTAGLRHTATQLLEGLQCKRGNDIIPVVFVGHSFGGVIAKMALWIANNDSRYLSIAGRTDRLFFLATPHQETESSPWADLLFNIALASTENTPTKREELLTSVRESGSAAVIDASERFYTFASQYQILSFYETKATEFMGSVVVPAASAQLCLPGEAYVECDADHMRICQFFGLDLESGDSTIKLLCDSIADAADIPKPMEDYYQEYIGCRRTLSVVYPEVYLCETTLPYPGTLGWLEENTAFSTWLQNRASAILHVHGRPGSGKSVLAAYLAKSLPQRRPVPNFMTWAVLSFRFDQSNYRKRSAKDLLFSFIRQLLLQRKSVYGYGYIWGLFTKMETTSSWTVWSLWAMFQSIVSLQEDTQAVCIVDGLDECDSTGIELLKSFIKLRGQADSIFKLIVTSRPDPEIYKLMGAFSAINLDTEPGMKGDRELVAKGRMLPLIGTSTKPTQLADKLMKRLCSFDITHLEINLALDELLSHLSASVLIEREFELPAEQFSLPGIYERMIHELEISSDHEWLRKALSWLIYANEPLTLNQLAVALAVNNETDSLASIQKHIGRDINLAFMRTLGPLIYIENDRVHFVHHTVRDFLIQRQTKDPDSLNVANSGQWNLEMAMTCLRYMFLDEFQGAASFIEYHSGVNDDRGRINLPPSPPICYEFLKYAAQQWPAHCRHALSEGTEAGSLISKVISFLEDSRLVRWWTELFMFLDDPLRAPGPMKDEPTTNVSGAVQVTTNGVEATQRKKPESTIPLSWHDQSWYNPLYLASRLGLAAVVASLSCRETYSTIDKLVALEIAAENGHVGVVKELMDMNDAEVISGRFPALKKACTKGHELVVKQLLHRESDESPDDIDSYLILSANSGHASVVRVLIAAGANVEAVNVESATALHLAASHGFDSVIEALLHSKANIDAVNAAGFTPVHLAAAEGHLTAVQTLLSAEGSDVETGTWTIKPLHMAAGGGHVSVIKELLKRKATLEATDSTGRTPLHWGAVSGHTEAVKELIDAGADLTAADHKRWVPLHLAADYDHPGVVDALLSKEADPDPIGTDRYRPLHLAAQSGYTEVVRRILKSGAIEDPTTDTKNTPLHLASFNGHPEVVEVLIEYGSDVDRKRSDGWSPLHCAYGDFEVTKRLLQSGASVYTVDGVERQPLCLSAAAGSERVVNMLLDAGADKNYLDRFGRTPLDVTLELPGKPVRLLLSPDGTDKPIGEPLTCNIIPGTKANVARTWSCNCCRRSIEDEFFHHCCDCEYDDFDICTTCYNQGKRCHVITHQLKVRFLGDGMLSCSELSRWVGEMKLPKESPPKASSDTAKMNGEPNWHVT